MGWGHGRYGVPGTWTHREEGLETSQVSESERTSWREIGDGAVPAADSEIFM